MTYFGKNWTVYKFIDYDIPFHPENLETNDKYKVDKFELLCSYLSK